MQLSDSNELGFELIDSTHANTVDNSSIDILDNTSETNEIDIELIPQDTNDERSDTIDNFSDDANHADATADITGSLPDSPTASTIIDIYHFIEERLLSLDAFSTMALGTLTYHEDFHPHYFPPEKDGSFGKTLYKRTRPSDEGDAAELGLVFFGEVCPSAFGTAISAKGNHYAGTAEKPKPITDNSIVKDIIVLRPLSIAPLGSLLDVAFKNQCAGLEEILDKDAEKRSIHPSSESIEITEFLVTADPCAKGTDRSFIKLTLPPKYKVPTADFKKANNPSKPPTNKKTALFQLIQPASNPHVGEPSVSNPVPLAEVLEEPVLEFGALYNPKLLGDYHGELFQHKFAKVVQQDITDTENKLVAPWLMHDKLRPGTVVVVDTTLVCWHIGGKEGQRGRNVYQVQAHRIRILHESHEDMEELTIPTLPQKPTPSTLSFDTSPRKAPSSAFSAFGSPSKKARRM